MAENSAIEWCDHTFSPWEGCQKVGPGCDHCYAEARDIRFTGGIHWGPGAPRRQTSPANWAKVRRWQRDAKAFRKKHGHWPRVFCASLADVFDNAVDPTWRKDLWELIRETPDLRWILLTKRIGNVAGMLPFGWLDGDFDHVGVMITLVDQKEADRDAGKLRDLPMTDAQWRGVSYEPALGPIDWTAIAYQDGYFDALRGEVWGGSGTGAFGRGFEFIIWGGESGLHARAPHPDWARSTRDQCAAAGTAFLMKQWGEWAPSSPEAAIGNPRSGWRARRAHTDRGLPTRAELYPDAGAAFVERVGKRAAGRLLDGRTHDEFPSALS